MKVHLGTDGHIYAGETGHELIASVEHGHGEQSVKAEYGRHIVACVNAHDDLLAACRALLGLETTGDKSGIMRAVRLAAHAVRKAEGQS